MPSQDDASSKKSAFLNWWDMFKPLGFVLGVPVGIGGGVLCGAVVEVAGGSHSAAWGVLFGIAVGLFGGGGLAAYLAARSYKWVSIELAEAMSWNKVVPALNIEAAREHHLLVRREDDYVVYRPTLVTPVAGGPLTISGEYQNVVMTRSTNGKITITGPKWMVERLQVAADKANALEGV